MSVRILRRCRVQDAIKDLLETYQGQCSHNRNVTTKRQRNDGAKVGEKVEIGKELSGAMTRY